MEKLPSELCLKIFKNISIADCKAYIQSYFVNVPSILPRSLQHPCVRGMTRQNIQKFSRILEDRTSIELYLADYFPNVDKLLECMTKTNTIISGSRALDFFAGNSTSADSDWDFYAVNNTESIIDFMTYMMKNGVYWYSPVELFEKKIEGDKDVCSITMAELRLLQGIKDNDYIRENVRLLFNSLLDTTKVVHEVLRKDGSKRSITIIPEEYSNKSKLTVISGILTYKNASTDIQLIVSCEQHPLAAIVNFHTTIVQCAITGFCALHMYASHAYNRRGIIWETEASRTEVGVESIKRSIKKYRQRGFKFDGQFSKSTEYKLFTKEFIKRTIGDRDSDIVDYSIILPSHTFPGNNELISASKKTNLSIKQQNILNFSWLEYTNCLSENLLEYSNRSNKYDMAREVYVKTLQPNTEHDDEFIDFS